MAYTTQNALQLCGTHSPTRFQYSDNSNKVNECVLILYVPLEYQTCFFFLSLVHFVYARIPVLMWICRCIIFELVELRSPAATYATLYLQPNSKHTHTYTRFISPFSSFYDGTRQQTHRHTMLTQGHLILWCLGGGCGIYGIQRTHCGWCSVAEWIHCCKILMMQMLFFYCLWAARWR